MYELDPMEEWENHKREKRTHGLIVLGVFAAIGAGAFFYFVGHGNRMNESCETSDDCGGNGQCLLDYDNQNGKCTRTCTSDASCPDDMECHLGMAVDDKGKSSIFGAERVCMPK